MTSKRPAKTGSIPTTLIAPCGMNCRLCRAYTRDRKACPGCLGDDRFKAKSCVSCRIKNCERMADQGIRYCFGCDDFPCARLNHLDKRYRTKYGMSMIANLEYIRKFGIRHFIKAEREKWACPECGELLCVHKANCLSCQRKWR